MADSSKCGLAAGDVLTVRDLLYGLLLVSGNDAANVLAEYYSGSIDKFAEEMNREAKAWEQHRAILSMQTVCRMMIITQPFTICT